MKLHPELHPSGFGTVPIQLLENPDMDKNDTLVYVAISSLIRIVEKDPREPSRNITNREIRRRSGLQTWRRIHQSIDKLIAAGYISVIVQPGNESGNNYTLHKTPKLTGGVYAPGADTAPDADTAPEQRGVYAKSEGGIRVSSTETTRQEHKVNRPLTDNRQAADAAPQKQATKTSEATEAQLEAAYRKVDTRIASGVAVIDRDALAHKIALDDFDEHGNPTTTNSSPTTFVANATAKTAPEVEACPHCDDAGRLLEIDGDFAGVAFVGPAIPCTHNERAPLIAAEEAAKRAQEAANK